MAAGSRGWLQEAALALYSERGFDQTTAAQIADRVGVTERTFFRHFADKGEVIFGGSAVLQERIVAGAPGQISRSTGQRWCTAEVVTDRG